jgi:hypothetical protein
MHSGTLLSGPPLSEASRWLTHLPIESEERKFLLLSKKKKNRERLIILLLGLFFAVPALGYIQSIIMFVSGGNGVPPQQFQKYDPRIEQLP